MISFRVGWPKCQVPYCWDVPSDKSCFSPRDMPGVAGRGNLYSSNAKPWASANSTPAYPPKTRARIPWRPLEGTRTSEPSSRKYRSQQLPSQASELEGGRKWHLSAYKLIYRASLIIASLMFIIVVEPIFTLYMITILYTKLNKSIEQFWHLNAID